MTEAQLIEIFTSFQGEGPYIGTAMCFVRLQHCALTCSFCDTPESFETLAEFRYEREPHGAQFDTYPNPVSIRQLNELITAHRPNILSLTGGEPLQQARFIQEWLGDLNGRYRVLLETNGVLPRQLAELIQYIDIVSMDMKLPSVTGMRAYWSEHAEFLRIAKQKEVYVKAVVSEGSSLDEVRQAACLVRDIAPEIPFILQPVTPISLETKMPSPDRIKEIFAVAASELRDVRVIAQMHPQLNIL